MKQYDVYFGSDVLGSVTVTEIGLYIRFQCRCKLPDKQMYKLFAHSGSQSYDLGILIPDDEYFCLDKRLPQKRIDENTLHFSLQAKASDTVQRFELIDPKQPFSAMKELHKAHLEIRNGKLGIVI